MDAFDRLTPSFLVLFLLQGCAQSPPEPKVMLDPARSEDLALLNESWAADARGCQLRASRSWMVIVDAEHDKRYVAGALNGPGVEDAVAVWLVTGADKVCGANSLAREFNVLGSAVPLGELERMGIERALVAQIERAVEERLR